MPTTPRTNAARATTTARRAPTRQRKAAASAVAAVQQPDTDGAKYVSTLWELDPAGNAEPRRLTFSSKGESAPRFAADGTLLFSSARPDAESGQADGVAKTAIWRLPEHGEASVVADAAGGLSIAGVASTGAILASTSVIPGAALDPDASRRKARKDRGVTAILHTSMPIRYWDHELDDLSPRLVVTRPSGENPSQLSDLATNANTVNLLNASADLSPDVTAVATSWTRRAAGAETVDSVVLIDTMRRRRTLFLRGTADHSFGGPRSPRTARPWPSCGGPRPPRRISYSFLELHPLAGGEPVKVPVGDMHIDEYVWAPDGKTLYLAGDLHSRGAIVAIDPTSGKVRKTVAADAVYSSLQPTADGGYLYALRSTIDSPPTPVRINLRRTAEPRSLKAPGHHRRAAGFAELGAHRGGRHRRRRLAVHRMAPPLRSQHH